MTERRSRNMALAAAAAMTLHLPKTRMLCTDCEDTFLAGPLDGPRCPMCGGGRVIRNGERTRPAKGD